MSRLALAVLLGALLLPAAGHAGDEGAHSGRIVTMGAGGREITLEELGPWTPRSRPIQRVIELTPETRIVGIKRAGAAGPGQWPGGFKETSLAAADVHAGEWATVTTVKRGARLVALSVTVATPQ